MSEQPDLFRPTITDERLDELIFAAARKCGYQLNRAGTPRGGWSSSDWPQDMIKIGMEQHPVAGFRSLFREFMLLAQTES